jgi:hypothetical protein
MRLHNHKDQQTSESVLPTGKERIRESQSGYKQDSKSGQFIALALCFAVVAAKTVEQFVSNPPDYDRTFAPNWIPLVAAGFAAAGIIRLNGRARWHSIQRSLLWSGLMLMIWTANGLPFDLLRMTPLMPLGVDWPGLVTRTLALAAVIMLARIALAHPNTTATARPSSWYGYAAFVMAMPYPVLRICWALGGTVGLMYPGAAGSGFAPLLIAIPWILAAALSLCLASARPCMPRRLLLTAGWTATAIVAMIGPAAFWSLVTKLVEGGDIGIKGMRTWVPCLFYSSWFLWAIAAGAATRSYQLRSISCAH